MRADAQSNRQIAGSGNPGVTARVAARYRLNFQPVDFLSVTARPNTGPSRI